MQALCLLFVDNLRLLKIDSLKNSPKIILKKVNLNCLFYKISAGHTETAENPQTACVVSTAGLLHAW